MGTDLPTSVYLWAAFLLFAFHVKLYTKLTLIIFLLIGSMIKAVGRVTVAMWHTMCRYVDQEEGHE